MQTSCFMQTPMTTHLQGADAMALALLFQVGPTDEMSAATVIQEECENE